MVLIWISSRHVPATEFFDGPGGPERVHPVERASGGLMLGGRACQPELRCSCITAAARRLPGGSTQLDGDLAVFPPVQTMEVSRGDVEVHECLIVIQWREEMRVVFLSESGECRSVHVIIVVMRDDDDVDFGYFFEWTRRSFLLRQCACLGKTKRSKVSVETHLCTGLARCMHWGSNGSKRLGQRESEALDGHPPGWGVLLGNRHGLAKSPSCLLSSHPFPT